MFSSGRSRVIVMRSSFVAKKAAGACMLGAGMAGILGGNELLTTALTWGNILSRSATPPSPGACYIPAHVQILRYLLTYP